MPAIIEDIVGVVGTFPSTFASCINKLQDIRLSSSLMLVMEGLSVALILLLCAIVLFGQKSAIDPGQIKLQGASFSGISLGVVVAIFSLVGFECATAFGEEARNPLTTIPRAVIVSLLLTGAFFIEKIFAWPGMGLAVVNAIGTRDYPLVVGGVIVGSIMVTIGSILADLLYAWADPRLRAH